VRDTERIQQRLRISQRDENVFAARNGGRAHEHDFSAHLGSTIYEDSFVARLWTTGVHDYAETGVNTRLSAFSLFRGIAPFTS
jgi:hypothetical protein